MLQKGLGEEGRQTPGATGDFKETPLTPLLRPIPRGDIVLSKQWGGDCPAASDGDWVL